MSIHAINGLNFIRRRLDYHSEVGPMQACEVPNIREAPELYSSHELHIVENSVTKGGFVINNKDMQKYGLDQQQFAMWQLKIIMQIFIHRKEQINLVAFDDQTESALYFAALLCTSGIAFVVNFNTARVYQTEKGERLKTVITINKHKKVDHEYFSPVNFDKLVAREEQKAAATF